jgi:HSP20 family protein
MAVPRKTPRMPFSELSLLQREVNQLFERLAEFERSERPATAGWVPSADVYESEGNLTIILEVPGLQPESLRVVCKDHSVIVVGERKERRPSGGGAAFLCVERPQGRFRREIAIDIPVDLRQAGARLSGGLLTISLPRLKDRRGRETTIPIEREQP